MKFLMLSLCLVSASAFASFNEVECEGNLGNKNILVEVEQPFPNSSVFKRAQITVNEDGAESAETYHVTSRNMRGFPSMQYQGAGLRLEVDLWPDQTPRWGRNYRGSVYSSLLGRQVSNLDCRFPNAF